MKNKIILHIPHSSLKLPKDFYKDKFISKQEIDQFNYEMCDFSIDKIFSNNRFKTITAPLSRIYCDVEKFADDNLEEYSKFGLGVIYTKTNNGKLFFNPSDKYKLEVLDKYYVKFHTLLNNEVLKHINKQNVILIDCHSFSQKTIMDNNKKANLPDVCIGVNNTYVSKNLTKTVYDYFSNLGYKTQINYPYSGAMIPHYFFKNASSKLFTIMVEINKNLYMENDKTNKYKIKTLNKQINALLSNLENIEL